MLWTTLGFLAITALSVYFHLRTPAKARAPHAAPARARPCPRCHTTVPAGAEVCPRCKAPVQVFEVVTAAVAAPAAADADAPMRAHVRADMCVGCGTCVAACPEPLAITMRGKLASVDAAYCVGHGECATACPVGAIAMAAGAAVNRVVVPHVDANFETNIPGLHIVGELGGRGLIKNAVNEGKIAVEHIRRTITSEMAPDASSLVVDVAIVGSGPAGLSAGLEALRSGLTYVVLEQGSLADSVRKYPRHKLLFAEPLHIPLYGDLWVEDGSKEALLEGWEKIVAKTGLRVETERRVEDITREGWLFRLRAGGEDYRARRVVLAMGRRGTPRRLGVAGEELGKVFYDIAEMADFAGRNVLVVGGGDTAVESALGLANQSGTTVTLSYRGDGFSRVKPRLIEKLKRATARKTVTVVLGSTVREIRADVVVLDAGGEARILPNDDVIVRIGGDPPSAFLERMGVKMVEKEIPLAPDVASAG